ncbi:hypothetical protein FDECE_10380 [Fusarium decemcellulare]|nr:hypothetical protein FDECE_10380 [Fusarium decemcellulare]
MNFLPGHREAFLYAQGSSKESVGAHLGTFPAGLLGRVQCWDAVGAARREFTEQLHVEIIKYLQQNSDTVQDSGSIISLSLFMLGRSTTQAKPTVMFVSEDKKVRKEAFNMIKDSKIMETYPGFELGHIPLKAEFENLKFLAAGDESLGNSDTSSIDDSPDVFWIQSSRLEGRRLYFYTKTGSEENLRTATAGGIITYQGRPMLLTANHFLEPTQTIATPSFASTSEGGEDSDDECEITGLSDFNDEDEDRLIEITSQGSISPEFETWDVDCSRSGDNEGSILSSGSTTDVHDNTTAPQEMLECPKQNQVSIPIDGAPKQQCTRVGKVILRSKDLDYSLIEIDHPLTSIEDLDNSTIELSDVSRIEPSCRDAAVRATTPDGGMVEGALSGTPSYVCLPQSRMYVEVYLARFKKPLVPGDCGSWVRDTVTGRLFGHVFAGSPASGLTMIMPACHVFENARHLLESQSRDTETKSIREGAGKAEQERYQTQDTKHQSPNSTFEEATRAPLNFITMGTIPPSSSLIVGTDDLTDKFDSTMDILDATRLDGGFTEMLQLGLLKLRLCRWRNAVTQLNHVPGSQLLKDAHGAGFSNWLSIIEATLKDGIEPAPAASDARIGGNHWLLDEVQHLCEHHRGPLRQQPLAHEGLKSASAGPILQAVGSMVGSLEINEMRERLNQLRSSDADRILSHHLASEYNIGLLKQNARAWDLQFSEQLNIVHHQFMRTKVGGKARTNMGDSFAQNYQGPVVKASNRTFKNFSIWGQAKAHVDPSFTYHTHLHTNPNSPAKDSTDIRFGVLPLAISVANFVEFTQGLSSRTHPVRLIESTVDSITGKLDALGTANRELTDFTQGSALDKTSARLRAWARDGSRILTPKYFFWVAGTRLQKSKVGLLPSLLFEILRALPELIPSVSDSVGGTPDDAVSDDEKWRLADLENALLYVVERCKGHNSTLTTKFCFFIDGLDELEESRRKDETHIDLVGTLMAMSELPGVKLCVSSRPWDVFCQGLQDASGTLRLEDLTRDDMRNYTKAQLDTDTSFRNLYTKSHEYREFIDVVVVKANGVFLWVPQDLDEFFINTMRRIDKDSLPQAARIFWMAAEVEEPQLLMAYSLLDELPFRMDCSHHNLETMPESEVRIHKDHMRRRLDECSRGLLEIVEDEPNMDLFFRLKVDYIHRTVRDFLKQPSTAALLPLEQRVSGLDGYGWLAPCVALVQVLRRAPFSKHEPQIIIRLLKGLFFFARQAEKNQVDKNDLLQVLLVAEKAYTATKKEFELPTDINLALGLACQAKVLTFVESKPARDLRLPREPQERPPLNYALEISASSRSWQIHPEIVNLLLDKGADPDRWYSETSNYYYNPSYEIQRRYSQHQRTQFLYSDSSSPTSIQHDAKRYQGRSPWEEYITSVYQNPSLANDMRIGRVVRSLVGRGADLSTSISPGTTTMLTVEAAIQQLSANQRVDLCSQPVSNNEALTTALEGKRIVVIGAGIAGLSFVIRLRKQWPTNQVPPRIAIYDRQDPREPCRTERPDRSILLTGPAATSGREALQSLGLLEETLQYSFPEETDDDHLAVGPLLDIETEEAAPSAGCMSSIGQSALDDDGLRSGPQSSPRRIRYTDLHRILVKTAMQTDEIFWGVTCQNVLARIDGRLGVWLTAKRDEYERLSVCDYVIAADGASSTIRACLLSRKSPMMAEYQVGGVATFPNRVPNSLQTWGTRTAKDWVNRTPFCSYYAVDENHVIWDVNSAHQIAEPDTLHNLDESKRVLEQCDEQTGYMSTTDSKRERLKTLFQNTHPRALFSFQNGEKGVYSGSWDRSVVFIGDSNHAVGLSGGDGGSLALRDGWDLAEKFARSGDVQGAIEVYKDASTARASRELNFWGQGALNNGLRGVVSIFSVIRLVGNMFLIFLKADL